ncbi:MAG: hypothetical protein A3J47_01865 [Candidatus Yanofskybacteria bacterium RIFCSPHIGHO2_02_FULL_43_22]|uniref:Uncharacterized protein n=1 Tax=Candidatus Yanofskybacteria bacterium RIFCSPHIGHO2_02_FULL_43_22 TaxID=1802681 RepID=A0A1F8FMI5_9BACT|nr:MAG: hypothetical protein A3J47_01865 [Candidatus Yanofskybacteria bacterium RIFCSPHIGHO2_02_FULL_43_22]
MAEILGKSRLRQKRHRAPYRMHGVGRAAIPFANSLGWLGSALAVGSEGVGDQINQFLHKPP